VCVCVCVCVCVLETWSVAPAAELDDLCRVQLRVGILRNNKSATLYQTNSYVVCITSLTTSLTSAHACVVLLLNLDAARLLCCNGPPVEHCKQPRRRIIRVWPHGWIGLSLHIPRCRRHPGSFTGAHLLTWLCAQSNTCDAHMNSALSCCTKPFLITTCCACTSHCILLA